MSRRRAPADAPLLDVTASACLQCMRRKVFPKLGSICTRAPQPRGGFATEEACWLPVCSTRP